MKRGLLATFVSLAVFAAGAEEELVENGGFETLNTNWTLSVAGYSGDYKHSGKYAMYFHRPSTCQQDITFPVKGKYQLSFWYMGYPWCTPNILRVTLGDDEFFNMETTERNKWLQATKGFLVTAPETRTLKFEGTKAGDTRSFVDDVSLVLCDDQSVYITVRNFDEDLATVYVNDVAATNGQVVVLEIGDPVKLELKDFRNDYYYRFAPAEQTDRSMALERWDGVPAACETLNPATFTPDGDLTVTANVDVKGYNWLCVTNASGAVTEITNHVHRWTWGSVTAAARTAQLKSSITNVPGATENNLVADLVERVRYLDANYTITSFGGLSRSRVGTVSVPPKFTSFSTAFSSGNAYDFTLTNLVGASDVKTATVSDYAFYYGRASLGGRPATNFVPRMATSVGFKAYIVKWMSGPLVLENVATIGDESFKRNSITHAYLTSPNLATIGSLAFGECAQMHEVTFGAGPLTSISTTAFDMPTATNFIFLADSPSVTSLDNLLSNATAVDGAHVNRLTVDPGRASWWNRVTLPSDNEVAAGLPANCMGVYVNAAGDHKAWIVSSNSLNGVLLVGDMTMSGTAGYAPQTGLEVGSKVTLTAPDGYDRCVLQHLVGDNVWTPYAVTNCDTSFTYTHQGQLTRAVWGIDGWTLTTTVNNYGGSIATQLVSGAHLSANIYKKGSVVRLTATGRTTHPTSHFAAWTAGATGDDATNASILVTMDSDKSFSADFSPDEWLYTSSKGTMTDGEWTCNATVTDGKVKASSFTGGQNNLLWLDVSLPVLDAADEETTYPITEMGVATEVKKVRVGSELTTFSANQFAGTALEEIEGLGASQLVGFPYSFTSNETPIQDKTYDAADFVPTTVTYFENYCWYGGPHLTGTLSLPNVASFGGPFAQYKWMRWRMSITNLLLTCERLSVWPMELFDCSPLQSVTIGSTNLTTATTEAFTAGASTLKEIVFLAHAPAAAAFDNLVKAAKHTNMVIRCSKHAPGWRELRMADYWKQPEWSARPPRTWGMYQTLDGTKRYYMVQRDSAYDHRAGFMVIVR